MILRTFHILLINFAFIHCVSIPVTNVNIQYFASDRIQVNATYNAERDTMMAGFGEGKYNLWILVIIVFADSNHKAKCFTDSFLPRFSCLASPSLTRLSQFASETSKHSDTEV